jgi:hypothetical protein
MLEVNYMHITEKILNEIGKTLNNKYKVFVQPQEWALFKQPLTNKAGKMIKARFTKRQKKSVEIIRSILNVHGKTKIVKFLGQLASLEPQIQTLQPWVRDHVVHAINTFLIGVFILEKVNFPLFRGVRLDYPFMWKLCGLTHDLGYPIEIARNLQNQFVDKMNYILGNIKSPSPKVIQGPSPTNLDKLCEHIDSNTLIQERLTDWALGIEIEDYYDWLQLKNNIVRENHNFNQKNFSLDIVSASSALFIHNINLNYYGFSNKISFELAPLAFLLFLCDTFQEWDRYSKNRLIFSGNDFDIHCQHHSISLFVPEELEDRIFATLFQRLTGLLVKINGRIAVT